MDHSLVTEMVPSSRTARIPGVSLPTGGVAAAQLTTGRWRSCSHRQRGRFGVAGVADGADHGDAACAGRSRAIPYSNHGVEMLLCHVKAGRGSTSNTSRAIKRLRQRRISRLDNPCEVRRLA
jgi:hypothetical protein